MPSIAFVENWSMFLATDTARRAGRPGRRAWADGHAAHSYDWYRHLPLKSFPPHRESQLAPYFFDWLDHPTYDAYWKAISPVSSPGIASAVPASTSAAGTTFSSRHAQELTGISAERRW